METSKNQDLIHYLQQQIRTADARLRRFTHNAAGEERPRRFLFSTLEQYVSGFLNKENNNRMVIMPGFRGVGKTTLMAQLCAAYKTKLHNVLFLSVEDAKNLFDTGILQIMAAFEEILGNNLESIKEPVLIFLDEIQTDPKWAVTLKTLFEKTTNVFFCCTGSAAVLLQQSSPDLVRRAIFEKVPAMSFTEFEMTRNNIAPVKDLNDNIKAALYFSKNAVAAYEALSDLKSKINKYWSLVNRADIKTYLAYGSLPFTFDMPNETAIYDSISLLLDKIIKSDLPTLGNFDANTLNAVKRLLFAIAENDVTSLTKLEEKFNLNRHTITSIFEALEKAELLIKIPAYGANMTIAKKANKYLFMSPAIRMSFFYFTGIENTYQVRQGKLFEDAIGAHLHREFIIKGQGAIRYDSEEGGADFILQILNNKQIIIEAGLGDKTAKQILKSAKKIKSDYNIIFSNSELKLDQENNILFVPLDYYFLA